MRCEFITLDAHNIEVYVERFVERCKNFGYGVCEDEALRLSELFESGLTLDQIVDVRLLADNYAVNAHKFSEDDLGNWGYDTSDLEEAVQEATEDSLFWWVGDDRKRYFCKNFHMPLRISE